AEGRCDSRDVDGGTVINRKVHRHPPRTVSSYRPRIPSAGMDTTACCEPGYRMMIRGPVGGVIRPPSLWPRWATTRSATRGPEAAEAQASTASGILYPSPPRHARYAGRLSRYNWSGYRVLPMDVVTGPAIRAPDVRLRSTMNLTPDTCKN